VDWPAEDEWKGAVSAPDWGERVLAKLNSRIISSNGTRTKNVTPDSGDGESLTFGDIRRG
jgi:hypothetical protein